MEAPPTEIYTLSLHDALPIWTLHRRLWFGHNQQGDRLGCRRPVRALRAGVSQVRFGEEGPAHQLLPDAGAEIRQAALRVESSGFRRGAGRLRVYVGQSAGRLGGWRAGLPAVEPACGENLGQPA